MDRIEHIINRVINDKNVMTMKRFRQHKNVSTYEHSINVVQMSLKMAQRFHLTLRQINNMIIGAMLHDFYLYDYHVTGRISKNGIHAWSHPKVSLNNALMYFDLNKNQKNIIRSHMFPTTLFHPPLCKEAFIVCIADKICAFREYFIKGECV